MGEACSGSLFSCRVADSGRSQESLGTEGGFAALLLGRVAASATSHSAWEVRRERFRFLMY